MKEELNFSSNAIIVLTKRYLKKNDVYRHRPEIIAVELLYQKFQYEFHKGENDVLANVIDYIHTIPINILPNSSVELFHSFVKLLKDDWEFRYLFNYLLRDDVYDNEFPYNKLIEAVGQYTQLDSGGNHV